MVYCKCFLACFFVTMTYAGPTIKRNVAADDGNTNGNIVDWSHLIKKRSPSETDADDGVSSDESTAVASGDPLRDDDIDSSNVQQPNDFDWQLLQSSNNRLTNEIRRRRRRAANLSIGEQRRRVRSKRASPPRLTPFLSAPSTGSLIGDDAPPVERWGSEQNIAFDGDDSIGQAPPPAAMLANNNQVQLTESDLKKLANLIETMQHLNEEGYEVEGRPNIPQRDNPYTDNIEWDENPEIEEVDGNKLRQLFAAYQKMRANNLAQNEINNARWINYPRNYPRRNLRKRSYNGPPAEYYGYDVLDDAALPNGRNSPIRVRIPPEYLDVVDDENPNQRYQFAVPGRNLILIDTDSLNGYLPAVGGGRGDERLSDWGERAAIDPDRLQSEMTLEKKIFDLANQVRTNYRRR